MPHLISPKGIVLKDDLDARQTERIYKRALRRLESASDLRQDDKVDVQRFINHLLAEGVGSRES
jgi:hypothetical protein